MTTAEVDISEEERRARALGGSQSPPHDTAAIRPRPRWLFALGLFVLAPLVGEYLLGNQPITLLPWLLMLAPLYGGGAILVREVARHTGAGWRGIILLAAAYALLEEGPIDQMLFNPAYLGLESFAGFAPIPVLGISGALLQGTLTLHTVWSICVPIALVEAFDPMPEWPWLGKMGLAIVATTFVLGSTLLAILQYAEFQFMATSLQLGVVSVAIVALLVLALRRPRMPSPRKGTQATPAPASVRVGIAAFMLTSLYWIVDQFVPFFVSDWVTLGFWIVLAAGSVLLLMRMSQRPGWGQMHRLAVAAGALLTYVWAGFLHAIYLDVRREVALLGNVIFGVAAIMLLVLAIRAQQAHLTDDP